jgi:hypothetical protein
MRTTQELLEYVDRMLVFGVDKTEMQSRIDFIDLPSASGEQDENFGKMLIPLEANAIDLGGMDGDGI